MTAVNPTATAMDGAHTCHEIRGLTINVPPMAAPRPSARIGPRLPVAARAASWSASAKKNARERHAYIVVTGITTTR